MVTDFERRIILALIRVKVWKIFISMRLPTIKTRWGTRWVLKWMVRRQIVDSLHHAPCCPANHYCRMRLVFRPCNCGAAFDAGQANEARAAG